jgi:hypothetical protein
LLRLDLTVGTGGGGTLRIAGCSSLDVLQRVEGPASGTTLVAAGGFRDDSIAMGAQGGTQIAYANGSLVMASQDWWMRDAQGHSFFLGVDTAVDQTDSCQPLTVTASAVGDVVPIQYQLYACDQQDSNGNCTAHTSTYSGDGCEAIYRNGHRLVETIKLGECDSAAWPAIPAVAPRSQTSIFSISDNRGFSFRQDGVTLSVLPVGTYRFVMQRGDHLVGPGVTKTAVRRFETWVLTLRKGIYRYWVLPSGNIHKFVVR